ncbi:MAG: TonB-dependent receptor plug domain-containing protein, partial [Candidatus Marinimicrobia bacterium]|nr:TonB-dependent receptor plug domain-containing protein [Candidatus Neomarinimicrobiota bacterium]
ITVTRDAELHFELGVQAIEVAALQVIASRAKHRETPIAFTDISEEELKLRVASRDLPMILNETPGVYGSMGPGASGDSRVNVRGFSQRNTAIMINGVPVNDMENGWVYWSNWDGMADVTSSIQVQRGLGSSNLATASIGGTINVLTSAAERKRGYTFKQEIGSERFIKTTFTASTGTMNNGFSASILLQKKTGRGWVDGTWTDAYSYFLTINKAVSNHIFDFTLLGAPQQHGQRDSDALMTKEDWESFEGNYSGYNADDYRRTNTTGISYGWGFVSEETAEGLNTGTKESTDAMTKLLFGEILHTRKVGDKWVINNRTNYYHKPVYNFNWYWKISDITSLSTVLYGSNGRGGGTGPLNNRGTFYKDGEWKYHKYINPAHNDDGSYDWQGLIDWNHSDWDPDAAGVGDPEYDANSYRAKAIIRSSVNHHNWYGAISSIKHKLTDNITLKGGIDLRSYEGLHYREVVNLLGGDYYIDTNNYATDEKPYNDINEQTAAEAVNVIGDKIAYHNNGYNKWMGGYGQAEYATDQLSAFVSGAYSRTQYQREDFMNYTDESGDQLSEKALFPGYAVKLGANYNINKSLNVFGNFGMLSIAPKFTNVYLNYVNDINPDAKNESVNTAEFGVGYTTGPLRVNTNVYRTEWNDKSITKTKGDDIYNISGLNALHQGVEMDFVFAVLNNLNLRGAFSYGDWIWNTDVNADVVSDNDRSGPMYRVDIFAKGLHVGDAPQTQASFGLNYQPIQGLTISPVVKYFDRHFAQFDPADRDDADDAVDSWQLPSAFLTDLHVQYVYEGLGIPLELGFHLLNATDAAYISDAEDGYDHDEATTKFFYGLGRQWIIDLGVRL